MEFNGFSSITNPLAFHESQKKPNNKTNSENKIENGIENMVILNVWSKSLLLLALVCETNLKLML